MEAEEKVAAGDEGGGGGVVLEPGETAAEGGRPEPETLTANLCPRVQC